MGKKVKHLRLVFSKEVWSFTFNEAMKKDECGMYKLEMIEWKHMKVNVLVVELREKC